jgi:hypothetical protein
MFLVNVHVIILIFADSGIDLKGGPFRGCNFEEKPCNFVVNSSPQCCSNAFLGVQWYEDLWHSSLREVDCEGYDLKESADLCAERHIHAVKWLETDIWLTRVNFMSIYMKNHCNSTF